MAFITVDATPRMSRTAFAILAPNFARTSYPQAEYGCPIYKTKNMQTVCSDSSREAIAKAILNNVQDN